ncbi:MAG: Arm DNA-binding domain-containing protein, partial [Altibacter sp.]|nr:Arm DNA-binding domain-containing protein [Altibacter sp.]
MATIKYRIKGKSKNASIYLKLSIDRNNVYEKKTGLSINPKHWGDKNYPKQTSASTKKIALDLRKLETKILEKVSEGQSEGVVFSSQWLENQINFFFNRASESGKSDFVTDAIQHLINTAPYRRNSKGKLGLSRSRVNDYKTLKRIFIEYKGERTVKVKSIDVNFGNEFLAYLIGDKNYSQGYSLRIIDNLKS